MWRFSLAVTLIAASAAAFGAQGFYSAAEEWVVTKHQIDGRLAAVRTNTALPALATKKEFGFSIRFIVPFNTHNDRPFPERLDREGFEKIEEAIENRLVETNVGVFATIVTTNNIREFLLYIGDAAQAQAIAEKLVADIDHHKISFRLESDPDWEAWSKFAVAQEPGR
jgi:Family of unknown function (DUF695)